MAYTTVWNATTPLGTVAANTIDTIFQGLKVDIQERLMDIFFAMPAFTTDPLRPYGLRFTDAADAVITFGDNGGTPRSIVYKDKTAATTYQTHRYTGITLSPPTLTGSSTPFLTVTQTWNNGATTFVGISVNITDTASVAGSLFIDLQVAAASKFSVSKTGIITAAAGFAITGNSTITGTLTALTGITSSGTAAFATGTYSGTLNVTGTITGNLTGNVTGNASGTAATVTGATQAAITTCANLVSIGTITTGVWSGTAVGATKGGTAQTTYAQGDILYASAADTLAKLAKGTSGYFLKIGATIPEWAAAVAASSNRCRVTSSGSAGIVTATATACSWNTETYDVGGFWVIGSPTRFTIPSGGDTGKYLMETSVLWSAHATGYRYVYIRKNGTTIMSSVRVPSVDGVTLPVQHVTYVEDAPVVADYFEVVLYHTAGVNIDFGAVAEPTISYFSITHIG